MDKQIYTLEDHLELLVGLKGQGKFSLETSDISILQSIGRQVFKGTALTDRQYELVKEKLSKYKDQFSALEYDVEHSFNTLRMPLREIDRTKYVKIVSHLDAVGPNEVYESYKQNWQWIKVRFPFSKKLIVAIEEISRTTPSGKYYHKKGSHEHYFHFNEKNIFEVVEMFQPKNFEIDDELLELYQRLKTMNNNKDQYIPGIYNFKLKNLTDRAVKYMLSSIGEPSIETLALYRDRQHLFGLHHFDDADLDHSISQLTILSKKIVTRKHKNVFISNQTYNLNRVSETILELNRFPLLVVLPDVDSDNLSNLSSIHQTFNGFVDNSEMSVLFRLDNQTNSDFNDYIKKNNLNSPVDKDTKIVYINSSNVPKPLIQSNWRPSAVLLLSSTRQHTRVSTYSESVDLIIHYDETPSQFMRRNLDIL